MMPARQTLWKVIAFPIFLLIVILYLVTPKIYGYASKTLHAASGAQYRLQYKVEFQNAVDIFDFHLNLETLASRGKSQVRVTPPSHITLPFEDMLKFYETQNGFSESTPSPEGGTSIFLRIVEVFISEVSGLFVSIIVGTFFIALIGNRSTTSGLGAGDDVQTIHPSDVGTSAKTDPDTHMPEIDSGFASGDHVGTLEMTEGLPEDDQNNTTRDDSLSKVEMVATEANLTVSRKNSAFASGNGVVLSKQSGHAVENRVSASSYHHNSALLVVTQQGWVHEKYLGRGGEGRVDLFQRKSNVAEKAAVKVLFQKEPSKQLVSIEGDPVLREILQRAPQLFVEQFDQVPHPTLDIFCFEYMDIGTLDDYVLKVFNNHVPEHFIWHFAAQCAQALHYLHDGVVDGLQMPGHVQIVHYDLKPSNFLLKSDAKGGYPIIKLADFGLATLGPLGGGDMQWIRGTWEYMPPEALNSCGPPADIFAMGIMIHEMVHGISPWDRPPKEDESGFNYLIMRNLRTIALPGICPWTGAPHSDLLISLMSIMLEPTPENRINAQALSSVVIPTTRIYQRLSRLQQLELFGNNAIMARLIEMELHQANLADQEVTAEIARLCSPQPVIPSFAGSSPDACPA